MRRRDRVATSALRTALSAIDNAQAVPPDDDDGPAGTTGGSGEPAPPTAEGPIAGGSAGLGSAERPRRGLTEEEVVALVQAEVDQHLSHVADAERAGRPDQADDARARALALRAVLDGDAPEP